MKELLSDNVIFQPMRFIQKLMHVLFAQLQKLTKMFGTNLFGKYLSYHFLT